MNCLSFDVGGTTIKYGVINSSYKVIHKGKIPTPKDEEKFIEGEYQRLSTQEEKLVKMNFRKN